MSVDEEKGPYQSALIRRFDFSSSLQRMSVICKNYFDNKFRCFVKGSPEKIQELCDPQTMPGNYDEVLEQYTKEGFRVIGLATKPLPNLNYRKAMSIQRSEIEKDLTFLGLLIMENKLQPETPGAIAKL